MTERERLHLLARARDRADEMLGAVAASVRERIAQELVRWFLEGATT